MNKDDKWNFIDAEFEVLKGAGKAAAGDNPKAIAVMNQLISRAELIRKHIDPRRSIEDECGWKENLSAAEYFTLFQVHPIARRIVRSWPRECWQVQPSIFELNDPEKETSFEASYKAFVRSLYGENSWYKAETGTPVAEILRRADEQSRIGRFGIVLYGIADGKKLAEPAIMYPRGGGPTENIKVNFIRVFPEHLVEIANTEPDELSPRFGLPTLYRVSFGDSSGIGAVKREVHWTRVLHIADNVESNELFGTPAIQPNLRPVSDLTKLYGGSAEMYWLGAFGGIALEGHQGVGLEDIDEDKLKQMMEDFSNGLQRWLALLGMTAKSLSPQVVSPAEQIRVQLEAICVELEMPNRVFMGSERGDLASTQDDSAWNDRVGARQDYHCTTRIVVPFVNRLIALGVLAEPEIGFNVTWPDITSQSSAEKAAWFTAVVGAMVQYIQAGLDVLIDPLDFLTTILDFEETLAKSILAKAEQLAMDAPDGEEAIGTAAA